MVTTNTDLYATDFVAWCQDTAALVRTGQWEAIDTEALAEELDTLGRSEKRALESDLEVLLIHLIKWQQLPTYREESHSWFDTIVEHRSRIARLLRDNPSLRPQVAALVQDVYPTARTRALGAIVPSQFPALRGPGGRGKASRWPTDTGLLREMIRRSPFPTTCPWTADEVLHPDFWPE